MTFPTEAELRTPAPTARSWFPRSWAAFAVFLLLAAVMAVPVLMAFFLAYVFFSECFLVVCTGPQPGAAVVAAALGQILAIVPL